VIVEETCDSFFRNKQRRLGMKGKVLDLDN
jgi:hypothetical protein